MPNLPTIDVTQAQADRLMAAYGSIAAYRAWLRQAVVAQVIMAETELARQRTVTEFDTVLNPPANP